MVGFFRILARAAVFADTLVCNSISLKSNYSKKSKRRREARNQVGPKKSGVRPTMVADIHDHLTRLWSADAAHSAPQIHGALFQVPEDLHRTNLWTPGGNGF